MYILSKFLFKAKLDRCERIRCVEFNYLFRDNNIAVNGRRGPFVPE